MSLHPRQTTRMPASALGPARRTAVAVTLDALAVSVPACAAYSLGAGQAAPSLLLVASIAGIFGAGMLFVLKDHDPATRGIRATLVGAATGVAAAFPFAGVVLGWLPALGVSPLAWALSSLALLGVRQVGVLWQRLGSSRKVR